MFVCSVSVKGMGMAQNPSVHVFVNVQKMSGWLPANMVKLPKEKLLLYLLLENGLHTAFAFH